MKRETGPDDLAATISERLAQRIRQDILKGRFPPGRRLKIADFATLYGVSHMPVREALRRLEGEGLIEVAPHRGATVRAIDASFIAAIYEVREALEGILTERCAERATEADIRRLEEAARQFAALAAGGESDALIQGNRRFHAIIFEIAGNDEAARILETGRILIEALRQALGRDARRLAAINSEHEAIVAAIRARTASEAGLLARRHVAQARDDLLARWAGAGTSRADRA
jgi:DNA-binding GntR family transcriptional regulator